jgi:transcriptional regulator GlxA family with amidase domain
MPGKKNKASAIEEGDECVDVLFILHDKFNLMDLAGPLEAFGHALHDQQNKESKAFEYTLAGPSDEDNKVMSSQGIYINAQISYKEAHERLDDFDVVVVLGGNVDEIIKCSPEQEPLKLINAFAKLQQDDNTRERTLLSVCTGSLILAKLNLLDGLVATTHPNALTKFEILCSEAAQRNMTERAVVEDDARYVVNNLRFEVGEEGDENPYVRRGSDAGRRPSNARKGSISLKSSGRRESILRRASMRLGGLRVITSGGISAGVDAALYTIGALVSDESANAVAEKMQWTWKKGIVVDGVDV